jgi:hypothetical protein
LTASFGRPVISAAGDGSRIIVIQTSIISSSADDAAGSVPGKNGIQDDGLKGTIGAVIAKLQTIRRIKSPYSGRLSDR